MPVAPSSPRTTPQPVPYPQWLRSLKRAFAMSSSNSLIPSTLVVARAGAELAARPRSLASSVLESVMAAVPAKPATSPLPTAPASVLAAFLIRRPPSYVGGGSGSGRARTCHRRAPPSRPERVRHRGEGRVHRARAGEEARVHDVEVVDVVGLAVHVERRALWVLAEADGAALVGDAGQ